jgi:hypothetical protein
MNRLIFHNHDNVSIRNDNRGIIPLIPILIAVLIGGGMALVAWAFFAELWISTMIFLVIFFFIWMMIKGMERGIVGKRGFVLGIVLIVIFLILAIFVSPVMFTLSLWPDDFDPEAETHTNTIDDFTGGGQYPNNGVFSRTQYIMSWLKNGQGQDITIAGTIIVGELAGHAQICKGEYRLYLTDSSSWGDPVETWNWLPEMSGWQIGGTENLPSKTHTPAGSYDGWAKVEVWVETHEGACNNPFAFPESGNIAVDYAYLRSGVGDIWFEPSDQVVIGDTLKIWYDVGWSSGEGGNWVIVLTSLADGEERERFYPEDDTHNNFFEYVVSTSDFQTGDPCPRNALRATLYNSLNLKDIIDVTTTDIAGIGPPEPTISISPSQSYYNAGDEITITVEAEPNPDTMAEIIKYYVVIAPDGDDLISDNNKFTYTFAHSGEYEIQAYCQDVTCHMSAVAHKKIQVLEPGEEHPIVPSELPWIFVIVLLIWGIASAWIYSDKKLPGTSKTKLMVVLGGFAVIALLFFMEVIPYG